MSKLLFKYHVRMSITSCGGLINWSIMRTNKLTGTVKTLKSGSNKRPKRGER